MAIYIGWSVNHEPLDQTNLNNSVDWILMAVGESSSKRADKWARGWPVGHAPCQVGPSFGGSPSRDL
jgi:hypothetical protein